MTGIVNAGQVTVGTSATSIVSGTSGDYERFRLILHNNGAADVTLGPDNSVTTTTGHVLKAGADLEILAPSDVYGIVGAGTTTVSYWAEYGVP